MTDVSRDYGDRTVLRSVNLTLSRAECVAVTGPNGSGKSTLLRLATGRERPTSGEVLFDGAPVSEDDPAVRRRLAAVMDAASFYPDLTVREHLVFVALAHGLGRAAAEEAVTRALADHRLAEHADVLPDALSSGQTQQVLLAAAFLRPHDLLVLDEPEQRLDTAARAALARRLCARKAEGTAILLVTHHDDVAAAVADRVLDLADLSEAAGA
ncbi:MULTISPECIES: ABC transporter ATP-binding protein [Streptomyces]|uniref:ABC transporter ATP-binding protein n=1 Tax=Streptomyces TaxID=1883 RepID=UPI001CCA201B|nr:MULTISPECIES: ABC transporter ATP-binding protein [Streptomyces]UBI35547.1 ABC transporter ATP-binding protein [Streptomyces mobaraensis]UKW28141.1 ABC transporter ATP-binding protein [Streptomyces sp. TYQ1024]